MAVKKEKGQQDNHQFERESQKECDDMLMRFEMQRTKIFTQE